MTAPPAREPSWKITAINKGTGEWSIDHVTDLEEGIASALQVWVPFASLDIRIEQEPEREEPAVRTIRCQYEQSDQMMIELGDPTVGFADGWAEVPIELHSRYRRAHEEFQSALEELDHVIHAVQREEQEAHRLDEIIEGRDGPFLLEKGDRLWVRLDWHKWSSRWEGATPVDFQRHKDSLPTVTTVRCEKAPPAGSEEHWTLNVLKVLERDGE